MPFIKNYMSDSPLKESTEDKSVFLCITAYQSLYTMIIAYVHSCKGSFGELGKVGLSNCCL